MSECNCEIPLYYCTDRPDCKMVARIKSKTPGEITALRAKLAAAEARAERYRAGMREMIDCRTCRNHTRDGCIQTALCVDADGYRRALPVRFWVATHSAALAEGDAG